MEVSAKLRFTTPCLGNERREQRDLMLRSQDGTVVFLQSWWRCALQFAAKAVNRHQKEIAEVQADPEIKGNTGIYRRYYSSTSYKEHEAFLAGEEVEVKFWLPNQISAADFKELLSVAGKFVGVSPYGYKQDFGRFVVTDLQVITRKWDNGQQGS